MRKKRKKNSIAGQAKSGIFDDKKVNASAWNYFESQTTSQALYKAKGQVTVP